MDKISTLPGRSQTNPQPLTPKPEFRTTMPRAQRKRTSSSARTEPLKAKDGNASNKVKSTTQKRATEKPTKGKPVTPQTSKQSKQAPTSDCQAGYYLLLVSLDSTSDPNISRILSIPPETTFDQVHEALQIAFGWTNSHMHSFRIETWELFNMIGGKPLLYLQTHPQDSAPEANVQAETEYTLADILENAEYKGKTRLMYEYDMGDGWNHQIIPLGRADENMGKAMGLNEFNQRIACIAGEGHPCAEDCGGTSGWENLKETFKKARGGDKELKDWYKHSCYNGDKKGLDPYAWDLLEVNDLLGELGPDP
ncbi:MAG: hypothetical protein Q9201_002161 [Fulgogasparrea decipioides]